MKTTYLESLNKWLISLCLCICTFSMILWRMPINVHKGLVLTVLILWTLLIPLAEKKGKLTLAFIVVGVLAAFALFVSDHASLLKFVSDVIASNETDLCIEGDIIVSIAVLLLSVVAERIFRYFWPCMVASAVWVTLWIIAALIESEMPKLAIVAMVPVILYSLVGLIQRILHSKENSNFEPMSSGLMTLFTLGALLLIILPTSEEPYQWPVFHMVWEQVEKVYYTVETKLFFRAKGDTQFRLGFDGMPNYAEGMDSSEVGNMAVGMYMHPRSTSVGNVYLSGNSWNSFDGKSWTSTLPEETSELLSWNMDTAEHLYALYRYRRDVSEDDSKKYFQENSANVTYSKMHTRTVFVPRNALDITTEIYRYPFTTRTETVLFDYIQDKNAYYTFYYLEQNGRTVPELIKASEGYQYDSRRKTKWINVYLDFRYSFVLSMDNGAKMETVFGDRYKLIKDYYLLLPDDLSQDVIDLANEITAGCEGDYAKLQAIEKYLTDGFTYTISPQKVPEGKSLIDFMLFESHEGYCTWYATAATILARCAGVPARYVQGYCLPLPKGTTTAVTNGDAHAWCEGYISGYGWITVEATPGFSTAELGWDYEETEKKNEGTGSLAGDSFIGTSEYDIWKDEPSLPEENGPDADGITPIEITGIIVIVLAFASMCVIGVFQYKKQREYEMADYTEKAMIDLKKMLKVLDRRGIGRRGEESLRKYFGRVVWSLRLDQELADKVTESYEGVIFGGRQMDETEWKNELELTSEAIKRSRNR